MRAISIFLITIVAFLTLCGSSALAGQRVSVFGTIKISNGEVTYIDHHSRQSFKLIPYSAPAKATLEKLRNNDGISGTATLVENTLLLENIDFVHLRRLLGIWQSPDIILNFKNFSTVSFLPLSRAVVELDYAITPSNRGNNTWNIFFSGMNGVTLANLIVSGNRAIIQFYDPVTGNISQQLDLQKVTK